VKWFGQTWWNKWFGQRWFTGPGEVVAESDIRRRRTDESFARNTAFLACPTDRRQAVKSVRQRAGRAEESKLRHQPAESQPQRRERTDRRVQ
jgi:hypothetical protein